MASLLCFPIAECKTGEVRVTKGYKLPAKYIIHTVGPIYSERYKTAAEQTLYSCYRWIYTRKMTSVSLRRCARCPRMLCDANPNPNCSSRNRRNKLKFKVPAPSGDVTKSERTSHHAHPCKWRIIFPVDLFISRNSYWMCQHYSFYRS